METILNNINDPSWWFTGMFFAGIAYILPKVIRFFTSLPLHAEGLKRKVKLKMLRKIKAIRFDNTKVISEAVKTYAWMVVFVISIFVVLYSYITEPSRLSNLTNNDGDKGLVFFFLFFPVYIVEGIYLVQQAFYKKLIKCRERIRIIRRSC